MTELTLFTQALRKQRHTKHYTQEYTAELLSVSTRWYQRIEYGEVKPSFKLICRIAKKLDINYADFYIEEIL